jgi:hypothetical protein
MSIRTTDSRCVAHFEVHDALPDEAEYIADHPTTGLLPNVAEAALGTRESRKREGDIFCLSHVILYICAHTVGRKTCTKNVGITNLSESN